MVLPSGLGNDHLSEAMSARPGRNEECGQLTCEGLRLVVAGRTDDLAGPGDHLVQLGDDEMPFRDHLHAAPVIFHDRSRRRRQPAETATCHDRAFSGVAQLVNVAA